MTGWGSFGGAEVTRSRYLYAVEIDPAGDFIGLRCGCGFLALGPHEAMEHSSRCPMGAATAPAATEPPRPTQVRVDGLVMEPSGIVAIRHNLGSTSVKVAMFAPDGARSHARAQMAVSKDEVECIVADEQPIPTWADVFVVEDDADEPVAG